MKPLSIGFSPCPNDTFIFNRLVHKTAEKHEVAFETPHLEDVETLNQWALESRLDVTKLSYHAVGHLLDEYCVLPSGSALGRGCGPLLVAADKIVPRHYKKMRVAIPGKYTTAALLFRMFLPECSNIVEMRFEQIIDAIISGEVDSGVIIHESRFTYQEMGLHCLQDLGHWWETASGLPIPLGCIAVRRSLSNEIVSSIDTQIKASLEWARSHPAAVMNYIKAHAQETSPAVIQNHISLYVNDFSYDLGVEGRRAVERFLQRGRKESVLPHTEKQIFCC